MSIASDLSKLSVSQFAERYRGELIPLSNTFSYFFAGLPLSEEDIKEFLEDPVTALPPVLSSHFPKTSIFLVPYMERNGRERGHGLAQSPREYVSLEEPPDNKACWDAYFRSSDGANLVFAIKDQEVADYHYRLYRHLSRLAADIWSTDSQNQYFSLLREELSANVHGEVDEQSWHYKQALRRRTINVRRDTKAFRDYSRHSFIDTMTLYLHGICCDIDVDTGPRQLPSRCLRKRLMLLESLYPPPDGYCVFPEELDHTPAAE
jgi:hypothetical protein